jgi:hypothetical protein
MAYIDLPANTLIEGGRIAGWGCDIRLDGAMHCQQPARCIKEGGRHLCNGHGIFPCDKTLLIAWKDVSGNL